MKKFIIRKKSPIIRYSSSLIQQNHGETLLGHGISIWNVKDRSYKHIEIPNDYGYFTIDIDNGKLVTDITNIPKKPKLRVRCKESVASEVKKVISEIRKVCEITDVIYIRVDSDGASKVAAMQAVTNLHKITDVEYQNTLISQCLKTKYPDFMDDETIAVVHEINKTLNAELVKESKTHNIRWRPLKFEFSNMFSYGEDNAIDFTKLSDVYGLFAANASGKSSLMDALCFTMFDKSARAFKAVHIMNSQKMTFKGKFSFEINDVTYVIEREGTRDKKNNVKVTLDFYKLINDKKESLNGDQRKSTNDIIRDYIGTYDDFVLATLALQGKEGSLIDMGQTGRKELLSQFIGLDIFERLTQAGSGKLKEITGAIKLFNKGHSQEKLDGMKSDLVILESKLADLEAQKESLTVKKQNVDDALKSEQAKFIVLSNVPPSIDGIKKEKVKLVSAIASTASTIKDTEAELAELNEVYSEVLAESETLERLGLGEKNKSYEKLLNDKRTVDNDIEKLKAVVAEKIKKIDHLANHKYDPNCKFCCDNIFVKDAMSARESLVKDKVDAKKLVDSLHEIKTKLAELEPYTVQYQASISKKTRINVLSANISRKKLDVANFSSSVDRMKASISEIDTQVELYERSKEAIETNKVVQAAVDKLVAESRTMAARLKNINTEHIDAYSRKVSILDQTKLIEEQVKKIEQYEIEEGGYQYYLTAVGKDGVPYTIIADAVPRIEQEVNNILSQIVEFTIDMETDGKNVNIYIKYEDRRWPLDLCSGMEKFMTALALRVALINISNLPRPNFLVVDEGFSALDATNIAMIHALFDYLKSNFDFIIVISHLDVMRDMVDKQIEIKKENGFSRIDNTV